MSNTATSTTIRPAATEPAVSAATPSVEDVLAAIAALLDRGVQNLDGQTLGRLQASARSLASAAETEVLRRCGLA